MLFYILFLIFCLVLIFLSRRFNFLIHTNNLSHKRLTSYSKVSILGGILLIIFLFFSLNINNYLFFIPFFLLGLLSDNNYLSNPRKRIFIQIIFIILFVIFLKIKILKTNFFILDYGLNSNYFNIIFVSFCLLVLMNGCNFIDGLNTLLIGYILIIFLTIYFILPGLIFNKDLIKNFLFILLLLYVLNLFNLLYLGDSGSYILALFSGYLLINMANDNPFLSPFYIVLLLWYPCFENLFSIIRRKNNLHSSLKPDNKHLHQLIYIFVKNKFCKKNIFANIFSASIINLYNFLFIMFSLQFIYKTKFIIFLIIINITFYLFIYYYLNRKIKKFVFREV
jgi:UDP-N-acetylmuramyl pentapeptide phosphotransferase/UDP-N-acetylglucosamine-1-phosphate transferase